jgi:hypothetical protein
VGVVVPVGGRSAVERQLDTAGGVAQYRFEHDPGAVVEVTDDLVAGYEGKAHPVVEIRGRRAADERQVGSADAREPGVHPVPPVAGAGGVVDGAVFERADPGGAPR